MKKNLDFSTRTCLAVALIAALTPLACEKMQREATSGESAEGGAEAPGPRAAAEAPDDDYVRALAVANRFCQAWRQRRYAAGKALLTRRLVRQHPEQRLRDLIAGPHNPRHAAFEVFGGRRLGPGRFEFSVRLFLRFVGESEQRIETLAERIVLVRDGSGTWRVDDFPAPTPGGTLDRASRRG